MISGCSLGDTNRKQQVTGCCRDILDEFTLNLSTCLEDTGEKEQYNLLNTSSRN